MATITKAVEMKQVLSFTDDTPFYEVTEQVIFFVDSWDDISADVMSAKKFSHGRGIFGIIPTSVVASPGTFDFHLKNDTTNSAGLTGYYSPDHANIRIGFERGVEMRVGYTYDGSTTYHWRGKIYDITPNANPYTPFTQVKAFDLMYEYQSQKFKAEEVAVSQRGDQALTTAIAILPNGQQPDETSFDTGVTTFPFVFDSERDEKTTIMNVMQKIALSERGLIFINAGSRGEQLVFKNSNHGIGEATPQYDFDDSISQIGVAYPSKNVYTAIQVKVYPREIDASDVILGQLQKSFSVGAGANKDVTLLFRDPNGTARVSASTFAARVSGTDYTATANEDGTGADRTADMTVTETSKSANSIKLNVANGGGTLFWVQTLQQKGKGMYHYDPVLYEAFADTEVRDVKGERILSYNMPYEDDYNAAENIGDALLTTWQEENCQIQSLTIFPERSAALAQAFIDIDLGKRVTINLPQIGIDQDYHVRHMSVDLSDNRIKATYAVAPASVDVSFELDHATLGLLDGIGELS